MTDLWIAVFKVRHDGSVVLDATRGKKVEGRMHYLNTFVEDGEPKITRVIVAEGPDAREYLNELSNEPSIEIMRVDGNKLFYSVKVKDTYHAIVLTKDFFLIKPIYWKNGFEYWTTASYDKRVLARFPELAKKTRGSVKLLSLRKGSIDLFLPSSLNNLTRKQLSVFKKASETDYYCVPRKTSVKKLALDAGIPESTFREHLRKAEAKILSAILEKPL